MPWRKDEKYLKDVHTKGIMLRLSPQQLDKLSKLAKAAKRSKAAWLRERIEKARGTTE